MIGERAEMPGRMFAALLALLLVVAGVVHLHTACAERALETHEVFVAQTSREMLSAGDWIVPRFGGEMRLKKPPLMYWLVGGTAKVTGRVDVPEWVARVPSALAAVVMVAACVAIGAGVWGRRTGLLAGAMLAFCSGVFAYAGNARPEMLYAACTGASAAGFVWAMRRENSFWMAMIGWAGLGLAVLAKGPQLPGMELIGLGAWVVWERGWRGWMRVFRPVRGLVVALLVCAPWFVAVMWRAEEAGAVWKRELIGLRFGADDDAAGSGGSAGGFAAWLLEAAKPKYLLFCVSKLLPWGVLAPVGAVLVWKKGRPDLAAGRGVFCGLSAAMIGLSLAMHWRDYYLLPALPLVAVLSARAMVEILESAAGRPVVARYVAMALAACAVCGVGFGVGSRVYCGVSVAQGVGLAAVLAAGAVLCVLVVRGLRLDSCSGSLAAAMIAWAAAFWMAGGEAKLFGERRARIDQVARLAAEMGGVGADGRSVVAIGFDPNDLIYRVNRPIVGREDSVSAAELGEVGVVVAPTRVMERLVGEGLKVERREVVEVRKGMVVEVGRIGAPSNR